MPGIDAAGCAPLRAASEPGAGSDAAAPGPADTAAAAPAAAGAADAARREQPLGDQSEARRRSDQEQRSVGKDRLHPPLRAHAEIYLGGSEGNLDLTDSHRQE